MTERTSFRQAIVLAGVLALCGCAIGGTMLAIAASTALIARFDADKDAALDGTEVAALVAATVPGEGRELEVLRAGIATGYWTRDCDRDGRLTAGELAAAKCPPFLSPAKARARP